MTPRSRLWLFPLAALILTAPAQEPSAESPAATYSHGILRASIPYHATRTGGGQLTLEILDPEDHVVGRMQRQVNTADRQGSWQEDVKLYKASRPRIWFGTG